MDKAPHFIGLGNFKEILFSDPNFYGILWHTVIWVFGSTLFQITLGIGAALLLDSKFLKLKGLFRGLMMVSWVMPVITVGITWRWFLNGDWGVMNYYMNYFHIIKNYINWLGNKNTVWWVLLLASTWKGFPYTAVMFLAGLQSIPPELYEAAKVDGASGGKLFRYVTIPLMKPVIVLVSLISSISTWNNFRMIWVLTQGGPGYSTSVLSVYTYTTAFGFFKFGKAAALATLSFVVVLTIAAFYLYISKAYKLNWEG